MEERVKAGVLARVLDHSGSQLLPVLIDLFPHLVALLVVDEVLASRESLASCTRSTHVGGQRRHESVIRQIGEDEFDKVRTRLLAVGVLDDADPLLTRLRLLNSAGGATLVPHTVAAALSRATQQGGRVPDLADLP